MRWIERHGATLVVAALLMTAADQGEARADTQKEACATAYEQAQRLYRDGRYGLARSQLAICTQTCPTALASDCERWSREVDDAMASVVLVARDRQGKPLTEVRVRLDDQPLVERLDGHPVLVEPG